MFLNNRFFPKYFLNYLEICREYPNFANVITELLTTSVTE